MAERVTFKYRTSRELFARRPIHEDETRNPLDNTGDSATCSFTVFDADIDEVVTADSTSTTLNVTNAGVFEGQTGVEIELDSGAFHFSAITSVDVAAGTVTLTSGLPSQASAGTRVRATVDATAVNMPEFGTPDLDTQNWGFRGVLEATHKALLTNLRKIDVEITVLFGTLRITATICAIVSDGCD